MEERLQRFMEISDLLTCELENELAKSQDGYSPNVYELGQVVDMIKDISEIKRNCYEAAYYKKHTDKPDNGEETDIKTIEDVKNRVHAMWAKATVDEKKAMKACITSLMSEMII